MNDFNINKLNALISWVSIFALFWLIILGRVQQSITTNIAFGFFFVVAFLAAASDQDMRRKGGSK